MLLAPGTLAMTTGFQGFAGPSMLAINLIHAANESHWQLIQLGTTQICAQINWPATNGLSIRFTQSDCLLFDGNGRLLHIDMQTSLSQAFGLR